jgi:hypothetical protein
VYYCFICHKNIEEKAELFSLKCRCHFHCICIINYIKENGSDTCPNEDNYCALQNYTIRDSEKYRLAEFWYKY